MHTYWERKFIREVLLASAIVIIPFTIYFHTFFRDTTNGVIIFGFTIENSNILSQWYIYFVQVRLINIILLLFWFYTSNHWWKKFILIPVGVYFYFMYEYRLSYFGLDYSTNVYFSVLTSLGLIFLFAHVNFLLNSESSSIKNGVKKLKTTNELDLKKLKRFYFDLESHVAKMNFVKNSIEKKKALFGLLHLKNVVENNIDKKKNNQEGDKFNDLIIISLLIFTAILLTVNRLIPSDVQYLNIGFVNITNNGFYGVSDNIWFCAHKICSTIPLILWFATSTEWWRYALLSPILVFSYQLYAVLFESSSLLDETEYIEALPFVIILVLVLVFLSKLIKYQSKIMDLYEGVTHEITQLLNHPDLQSELYRKSKAEFEHLKNNGDSNKMASANIPQLLNLRKQLAEQIKGRIHQLFLSLFALDFLGHLY
jgi:hypothetical protein